VYRVSPGWPGQAKDAVLAGDISNSVAAQYGILVMHAMDMYRVDVTCLTPAAPKRLTDDGWRLLGYILGDDHLPFRSGPIQAGGRQVCYGYIAQRNGELVVSIRGTDGLIEWLEDAEFLPAIYAPKVALPPGPPGVMVEQGFWSIFDTMVLTSAAGGDLGRLSVAIVALVNAEPAITEVTVMGHSLGGPLASYLTLELARGEIGKRVSGCYFASPHPGNTAFATFFDTTVANYRVFNYILDIVPRVPFGADYAPLPRRTILQPATAEASIALEVGCNHHVISYCAMLDYEETQGVLTPVVPAGEEGSATCILGPEVGKASLAKLLLTGIGEAIRA
jgi:triacylglycerol lipase